MGRYGEVRGEIWGEIRGDVAEMGRCGEMWRDTGRYGGRYGEMFRF